MRVNVPIAGLAGLASAQSIDLSLTLGSLPAGLSGADAPDFFVGDDLDTNGEPAVRVARLDGGYYRIRYSDETTVVIDARGSAIWACGPSWASAEDTATYLLGPVLGFVLRLRGITCLHASAVAVDGKAVAFVGPAEAGKSSTAAAFARRGHPVLADDVAPLADLGDRFRVQPGYPRLRLWPDSAVSLFGGEDDALPRITPGWDKRYLDLNRPDVCFQREPLDLGAIYILEPRIEGARAARIRPLDARSALISLVAQTCAGRLLDKPLRAQEFELLGRLVDCVPVRLLQPADDLARAAQLCDQVIEDFAGLRPQAA